MIYVFKTSVKRKKDIEKLKPNLTKLLPLTKWNFDLEDCDKILRIESQNEITNLIIKELQRCGFHCEELPD